LCKDGAKGPLARAFLRLLFAVGAVHIQFFHGVEKGHHQAQALWPELADTKQLGAWWQQKLTLNATQNESLAGWKAGIRAW